MNCGDFMRCYSGFLDHELEEKILAQCEAHLKSCIRCSRMVAAYREGIAALAESTELDPPADLYFRVRKALKRSDKVVVPLWRRKPIAGLSAAAILLLTIGFGSMILLSDRNTGFYATVAGMDPTMDMVNIHLAKSRLEPAHKSALNLENKELPVHFVSYEPVEEAVFSYGVSPDPVIVVSGVAE